MSRRSRSILTVSVTFPVPGGMSEKAALETFKQLIRNSSNPLSMYEAIIKLEKKQTTFLS